MLRKLVSISLIIAILGTLVRFTTPYLWYYSNYNYIAHELCVNRHNPDADCDGTCQLKKMVQKSQDHDHNKTAPQIEREQRVNLFFNSFEKILISPHSPIKQVSRYSSQMETLWISEPDSHPPQLT